MSYGDISQWMIVRIAFEDICTLSLDFIMNVYAYLKHKGMTSLCCAMKMGNVDGELDTIFVCS